MTVTNHKPIVERMDVEYMVFFSDTNVKGGPFC